MTPNEKERPVGEMTLHGPMLNVPLLPVLPVAAMALTGAGPNGQYGQYGREEEWPERLPPGHLLRRAEEDQCGTVGLPEGVSRSKLARSKEMESQQQSTQAASTALSMHACMIAGLEPGISWNIL
jgi:hypothetical protein